MSTKVGEFHVDDAYPPNTDEQPSDVTHKVKLGDTVTFTLSPPSGSPIKIEAEVPIRKKLTLNVWRMNVSGVRMPAQVDSAVERIKEAYAQAGLDIEATTDSADWPESVEDLKVGTPRENSPGYLDVYEDSYTNSEGKLILEWTEEYKAFVDSLNDGGIQTIDLYFLKAAFGNDGLAVTIKDLQKQPGDANYKYVDRAFVCEANFPADSTPEHEILHLLVPEQSHPTADTHPYHNLMDSPAARWNQESVYERKRITGDQEELIYGHPAVVDP